MKTKTITYNLLEIPNAIGSQAFADLPQVASVVFKNETFRLIRVSDTPCVANSTWSGGNVVISNFTPAHGIPISQSVTEFAGIRHAGFYRYAKAVYNHILNDAAKNNNSRGYHPVRSWTNSLAAQTEQNETYLLRPSFGARGMAFVVVSPGEKVKYIATKLDVALAALDEPDSMTTEEFAKVLFVKSGIKVSFEGAYRAGEVKALINEIRKFELVQFVRDVVAEYRILTDYKGSPALIATRTRTPSYAGIEMVCGNDLTPDVYRDFGTPYGVPFNYGNEVTKLIEQLNLPLHSFDLFITQKGQWGFFEACCEFGSADVPNGWVYDQALKFIVHAATQPCTKNHT